MSLRTFLALVLALLLAGTNRKAYKMGEQGVQAKWTTEKLAQSNAQIEAGKSARAKEQGLQASADKLRDTQNAQIRTLAIDLDRARAAIRLQHRASRLQHRASRPADYVPPPTSAGAGCSPSAIFAEDADVALGLAAEADELRIAYRRCEAQYNAAIEALK